jgi:hypothetical protein
MPWAIPALSRMLTVIPKPASNMIFIREDSLIVGTPAIWKSLILMMELQEVLILLLSELLVLAKILLFNPYPPVKIGGSTNGDNWGSVDIAPDGARIDTGLTDVSRFGKDCGDKIQSMNCRSGYEWCCSFDPVNNQNDKNKLWEWCKKRGFASGELPNQNKVIISDSFNKLSLNTRNNKVDFNRDGSVENECMTTWGWGLAYDELKSCGCKPAPCEQSAF